MNKSILLSIKALLGITEQVEEFDGILIMHINTVFSEINQMGIGPKKCFKISSTSDVWSQFTPRLDMEPIKSYMYIKVKELFDPTANSQIAQSQTNVAKELEFRMHTLWDAYMKSEDPEIKSWVEANAGTSN